MSKQSSKYAIQPILDTNDIERLSSFYAELFGAEEYLRVPGRKGPFFVMLSAMPPWAWSPTSGEPTRRRAGSPWPCSSRTSTTCCRG
jgi:hypothetical protein